MTPAPLRRAALALAALGVAFLGAVGVLRGQPWGYALIALGLPLSGALALAGDALGGGFTGTLRQRSAELAGHTRPWMWAVAAYAALKIPVPLWPEGFAWLGLASTLALFVGALLYVWERAGGARALTLAAVAFGVGLGAEVLGSRTGVPFGDYSYATAPPPTVLGVPLLVPLGWFAFALAGTLLSGGRPWLSGLLLLLWDVGLEPLMTAQRYWAWSDPLPLWAGAPAQNFLAWWAVGALIAWLFTRLAPRLFGLQTPGWVLPWLPKDFAPDRSARLSLLPGAQKRDAGVTFGSVYALETFFMPGGLLLLGRPVEAGGTLLAMLSGLWLARRVRRD